MNRTLLLGITIGLVPAAFACETGDPAAPDARGAREMAVEPVAIASDPSALGKVSAIAELEGAFVAFSDRGAIAVHGGLPGASDVAVTRWVGGTAISAA